MIASLKKFLSGFRAAPTETTNLSLSREPGELQTDFQTLLMVSQTLTSLRDLDEVLHFLLGEIHRILGVDCGVLMLENDRFFRVRSHRGFTADFVSGFRVVLGEGPVGECFSMGQKIVLSEREILTMSSVPHPLGATGWKSAYVAPLRVQNQDIGVFLAGSKKKNFFSESMEENLEPLIQILAVGIRNAQLVEKMEKFNRRLEAEVAATTQELIRTNNRLIHRVRELKALYEITLSAGTSTSLEEILETVSARVQELFNAEALGFFINVAHKERTADLVCQLPSFNLPREVIQHLRFHSDAASQCGPAVRLIMDAYLSGEIRIYRGAPLALDRELSEPLIGAPDSFYNLKFHSLVAVPLKTSQKTLGVMVLANSLNDPMAKGEAIGPDGVTEEELRTLTLIAVRVASSIESVRLDQETQRRLADLATLREISDAFYATPVLEFVLGKVVKIVLRSMPCDTCSFLFVDASSGELTEPTAQEGEGEHIPLTNTKSLSGLAAREGKTQILEEVQNVEFAKSGVHPSQNIRSMMFVPLKVDGGVVGVLRLGSRERAYFNPHHIKLSELIAERAAVIIENARLYDKLLRANRELERLNQVKTEFVSMVSHELRTPVTAIKGFVDVVMMEEAGPINAQQKKFLGIAHNSIDRLALLISDLLDISRIESGQMKLEFQSVPVEKVVQDSIETYRATIEGKKLRLEVGVAEKMPAVMADESRIKQVMDNLLSNAMKFTPAGGFIRITAEDMGDFVLVGVQDSGSGINKKDHEKIFEKFYQVDSSLTRHVGGTGLGLSICKSIIDKHGGRIWVESDLGQGSHFRFLLPRMRKKS